MRTVLITGVAGFLGSYVARHYREQGWKVVGIDNVSASPDSLGEITYHRLALPANSLKDLLQACHPEVCVHCAGCASVGLSMDEPGTDFRGNALLVFEMLEALRHSAPRCRFVLLSSAAVYGDPVSLPVMEDHAVRPLSPYGYHKRQAELLCEEYARIFGLATVVLRIFSAYGPGLRRQVVWDICEKVLKQGQLLLHGEGRESRDFIHARDIARALKISVEKAPCEGEIYNLATGREVTIAELASLVLKTLGSDIPPRFDGRPTPGNPLRWRADISRISALGFAPHVSMEQGVAEVAAWAKSQFATP